MAGRTRFRDPLLAVSRLVLVVSMVLTAANAIACALGLPAMLILRDGITGRLVARGVPADAYWAILAVVGLVAVLSALAWQFLRQLHRIVETVAEGDPFVAVNARRLSVMGWITVAVHGVTIPLAMVGNWLLKATGYVRVEFGFPLAGILLALILFVLARVFREGTRMREELEGTV